MRTFDLRVRKRIEDRSPTPIPNLLILEVKCGEADYDAARHLVSSLPIPVDRCSKFVTASDPTHGPNAKNYDQ